MNTVYLILVILGFLVFDRIVRHKPADEIKSKNGEANKSENREAKPDESPFSKNGH